jgi:hypothetical protein
MEIKKPFIVNIYECVDRVAQGSDIALNESQIKEFWGKAELVEHEAQKHPGDGNRMWEAVIEIEDLGWCLVTHTYSFPTLYAARHWNTRNWLGFQENVGVQWMDKFVDPNEEWCGEVSVDRETETLTCLFTLKNPETQIKKMLKDIGDDSIKFEDLVLVKV